VQHPANHADIISSEVMNFMFRDVS
jgi:hypothetical protein